MTPPTPIDSRSTPPPPQASTSSQIAQGTALVAGGAAAALAVHAGVDHVGKLQQLAPIFKEVISIAGPILVAWISRSPRR